MIKYILTNPAVPYFSILEQSSKTGVGKVRLFGPLSAALVQILVIKHPLKAMIPDFKFSPFGIDIGNFEIQLLDLKE
jgi:hypothetical protein